VECVWAASLSAPGSQRHTLRLYALLDWAWHHRHRDSLCRSVGLPTVHRSRRTRSAWNSFTRPRGGALLVATDSADGATRRRWRAGSKPARRSFLLGFFYGGNIAGGPGCSSQGSICCGCMDMATATYVAAAITSRGRVRCPVGHANGFDSSCGGALAKAPLWRRRGAGIGGRILGPQDW